MSIPSTHVAKTICKLSNWTTSDLRLQKLVYISHMCYLGETENDLVMEDFEAWTYGPVVPYLYHFVKGYGDKSIPNIFPRLGDVKKGTDEYNIIKRTVVETEDVTDSALVSFTHKKDGAWNRTLGNLRCNGIIPRQYILEEFNARSG